MNRWIYSPAFDLTFIVGPSLVITLVVALIPSYAVAVAEVPLWVWVLAVLGIDVAHVYSTLFRTYLDYDERQKRNIHFILIPLLCWVVGVVLYSLGALIFWRTLAYVAVYHFIRQQYGFMMIYSRKDRALPSWSLQIDRIAIYAATLYPLVYWHTHARAFHWFVDGDFVFIPSEFLATVACWLYLVIVITYIGKEAWSLRQGQALNIGKNLLWLGTSLAWYVGIVIYNGDLAFTLTNVVSHGVPYIALVWIYGKVKWYKLCHTEDKSNSHWIRVFFRPTLIPVYLGILFGFAYIEEGLWDSFVWRDRAQLFFGWLHLPVLEEETLTWLVPLLVIPQATHYFLDAFIWRIQKPDMAFNYLVVKDGITQ